MRTACRQPSDRLCCDEDLSRRLAVTELEILQLNEIFKQVAQKHTEDMKRLEEKVQRRFDNFMTRQHDSDCLKYFLGAFWLTDKDEGSLHH